MASTGTLDPVPLVIDQIKNEIRSRIGTEWEVGDRLPAICDLARELGSGEKNTYRAVKSLSEEGILASRRKLGTFVMDLPTSRSTEEQTRQKSKKLIQLLVNPGRDGMIDRMAYAFIEEMESLGRDIKVCEEPRVKSHALDLRKMASDAFVLINSDCPRVELAPHQVLTLMSTGGRVPLGVGTKYDIVTPDDDQGGVVAGMFLKSFGLHDVAFVGVRNGDSDSYRELDQDRLVGLERGLDCSIPPHRRHYVEAYVGENGADFAAEYARMSDRPEVVFCSSDDIAMGFAIGSRALGLRPLQDYMLMGFDGQLIAERIVNGGITTVSVPTSQMGSHAAQLLDSRLDNIHATPRRVALGCTIRRGGTTPDPKDKHQPFGDGSREWPSEMGIAN